MNEDVRPPQNPLTPPRFENGNALLLAGLSERYQAETVAGIPALWQRFGPRIGHLPGQVGNLAYGVCFNSDGAGSFDYPCGVEVADAPDFERYDERFDPHIGLGEVEVWIPVKA